MILIVLKLKLDVVKVSRKNEIKCKLNKKKRRLLKLKELRSYKVNLRRNLVFQKTLRPPTLAKTTVHKAKLFLELFL